MSRVAKADEARWLAAFHAGEHWALEECYRAHATQVMAAARALLGRVDAETVAHEVFYRLLSDPKMRASFRGGNLGAWLSQVVTRSAIDDLRRRRRELASDDDALASPPPSSEELDAKRIVARFRAECLPPVWAAMFEARFLRQLSQRDAARELGIPRTTLVYQEQRVRALLQRFVLDDESDDSPTHDSNAKNDDGDPP